MRELSQIREIHDRGKEWPYASPNQYGMAVTAFICRRRRRGDSRVYPPGFKIGTYNIWGGHSFGLTQAICAIKQGNYNLMLFPEAKILDMVYCNNRLGHGIVFSEEIVTAARGSPKKGGGWIDLEVTTGGVDCQVNALPRDKSGELKGCCR